MRVSSLQGCVLLLCCAAVSVQCDGTVRGPAIVEDRERSSQRQKGNRSLKKGKDKDDDESDDYYYGYESERTKGDESHPPTKSGSIAPALSPSSRPDINTTSTNSTSDAAASTIAPSAYSSFSATERKRKVHSSKKQKKSSKGSKGSENGSDYKSTGKGKGGKGKGNEKSDDSSKGKSKAKKSKNNMGLCSHAVAMEIAAAVPEVITRNPDSCCNDQDGDQPIAVFVTHGLRSDHTFSGFELFWDEIYQEIERSSLSNDVCFVMTGIDDAAVTSRTLDDVLIQTNKVASEINQVAAMMVTDPTVNTDLITEIRRISDSALLPSIGLFNAGYNNVIIESILSGQGRLPYVGYLNDSDYGKEAGKISLNLLNGVAAKPLCLNSRFGVLDFVGERCAAYYNEITNDLIEPEFGVSCSHNSTAAEIATLLQSNQTTQSQNGINAVWASLECCEATAEAVASVRSTTGRHIVVGCQDGNAHNENIDFVTQQPIALQAYSASSWVNFPVIQGKLGKDAQGGQYFPGLQSLINTAIFNTVIL